jgi:hypothetical protein
VDTIATATTASDIPDVEARLVGATACLADAESVAYGLRLPFAFVDSEHPQFGRSLVGYPTGKVPVVRAYLVIGNVTSFEHEGSAGVAEGGLSLDYNESAGLLIVRTSPHASLRVLVDGLDLSVVVTDEPIGERRLTMCT